MLGVRDHVVEDVQTVLPSIQPFLGLPCAVDRTLRTRLTFLPEIPDSTAAAAVTTAAAAAAVAADDLLLDMWLCVRSSTAPADHRRRRRDLAAVVDRRRLHSAVPGFGAFARRHVAVVRRNVAVGGFLTSSVKQLPRVNIHLFLGTKGSHDGMVTERKSRLEVDGLMTARALNLGPCAKSMDMFAITIAVCCLFFWFLRFLQPHQNQPARTHRFPRYRCAAGRLHYNL